MSAVAQGRAVALPRVAPYRSTAWIAFGALMVDLCHRQGLDADLAKSLTITYTDKSKPTRIIGTPRPAS